MKGVAWFPKSKKKSEFILAGFNCDNALRGFEIASSIAVEYVTMNCMPTDWVARPPNQQHSDCTVTKRVYYKFY